MAYVAGNVGRLTLNGRFYGFVVADVEAQIDNLRVTNSEGITTALGPGIGYHASIGGNKVLTMTIVSASFDPVANPFALPLALFEGIFVAAQLFPAGIGGVSWYSPFFHITRLGQRVDVNNLAPITLSGESSGAYAIPFA
jgi:hypothetical protein